MIIILSIIAFLIWCYIGIIKLRNNGQGAVISMLDGDGATGVAYIMLFICMVFWPYPDPIINLMCWIGEKFFKW